MASSSRLSPGQKGSIVAKVSTAGRQGILTKTVYVTTNDPKRPQIQLSLTVDIKLPKPSESPQPKDTGK